MSIDPSVGLGFNPSVQFNCQALLFDLDGTLVDSIAIVDKAWTRWLELRGYDPAIYLDKIHGRRSIDTFRLHFPEVDADSEDLVIRQIEVDMATGIVPIAGALELLAQVPRERWALVTSGTSDVATSRVVASGVPTPPVAVYGEDVVNGKPAPDPYLLAAQKLGVDPADCVVFEDTLAGVRAGKSAGMKVICLGACAEADLSVPDFTNLALEVGLDGLTVVG